MLSRIVHTGNIARAGMYPRSLHSGSAMLKYGVALPGWPVAHRRNTRGQVSRSGRDASLFLSTLGTRRGNPVEAAGFPIQDPDGR